MPNADGLRVAIDAVGMRRFSGGPVVLMDLLAALGAEDAVARIIVFASPPSRRDFALISHPKLETVVCDAADASRVGLLRWVNGGLDRACVSRGADGLVSLNALGVSRLPTVVLFQQQLMFAPTAVRRMPLSFRLRLRFLRALARRACRRAAVVVAQAPHVGRSLIDGFGLEPARVRVLTPDVRWPEGTETPRELSFEAPTLFYVGTDDPYKSVETVLAAFEPLRRRFPELELALTIASSTRIPSMRGVRCLGPLPRAAVRRLLSQARALVMPSLAETIGLPLLEALDAGCPIIAADLPYAKDVCGDAALYFEAASSNSCVRACETLLEDSALRSKLILAGQERMRGYREAQPYPALARLVCQTFGTDAL